MIEKPKKEKEGKKVVHLGPPSADHEDFLHHVHVQDIRFESNTVSGNVMRAC